MTHIPKTVSLILLLLLLLLAAYPFYGELVFGDKATFFLQKLTTIVILAIFAMSLDLLVGVTGLVSLGHALFFGLTGYALALLSPEYDAANLFWVLPASLALCAVIALIVGILSVRTSGIYFIMVTLAFGQMGFYLMNDSQFAGGSDGLYIMMKPLVAIGDWQIVDLDSRLQFFYFTLFFMVVVYLGLRMLIKSPFGRVLVGIHANEHRTIALGYNTTLYKIVCFIIAGTLAGLAGFLAAVQYGFVNPSQLGWHQSGHALMMVIMGGTGTIFGAIFGAFVFEILHYVFESFTEHWLLLMGGVTIAVVLLLPKGLAGALLAVVERKNKAENSPGNEDAKLTLDKVPEGEL
jgi:branched-chain amino acid transport system permease protein